MSSESFRQQMGSSSSAILLLKSLQRLWTRVLTLISSLLFLAEGEGTGEPLLLNYGSLQRRLLEQRPLSEPLLIQATGNLHSSHDHHSTYACMAYTASTLGYPCISGVHCVVRTLYKQSTNRAGIFKQSVGARSRVGTGLSYRPWRNWFLGIDSWAP